ncbi:MAG: sce7726 family protein [Lachnospiraceae bacterium]|nr:sce7726 family protein [Lachnospiraceae bacterium]
MTHDRDIREPLFEFLEEQYGKVRIIEEKMMGQSRADVVMITENALFGLEIKSDADTYARLSRQVRDYSKFFDYNYVVVGTSHAAHIEEHVPDHFGIITVEYISADLDFYILRKPQKSPDLEMSFKIQILWRPELNKLLAENGLPVYRQKGKQFVRKVLADSIDPGLLNRQISAQLFERDYNTIGEQIESFREEQQKRRASKTGSPRTKKRRKKNDSISNKH